MASLLEDFYDDDLNSYSQTSRSNNMQRTLYQDENGEVFYYSDDNLQDDAEYYYVDDNAQYYYVDDNGNAFYYVDDNGEDIVEEIIYYDDDEASTDPQMFFKKEVHVASGPINTPKDQIGNSWDAASYERDKEIQRIADEEGLNYGDAYKEFGRRYEIYEPDLSEYL